MEDISLQSKPPKSGRFSKPPIAIKYETSQRDYPPKRLAPITCSNGRGLIEQVNPPIKTPSLCDHNARNIISKL